MLVSAFLYVRSRLRTVSAQEYSKIGCSKNWTSGQQLSVPNIGDDAGAQEVLQQKVHQARIDETKQGERNDLLPDNVRKLSGGNGAESGHIVSSLGDTPKCSASFPWGRLVILWQFAVILIHSQVENYLGKNAFLRFVTCFGTCSKSVDYTALRDGRCDFRRVKKAG